MTQDEEQLRLLSIFHYVVAGLAAFFALFPIIHVTVGLFMIFAPEKFANNGNQPSAFVGWVFVIVGATFIVMGLVFAAVIFTVGRFLARRKHYLFCLVVAGIECLFMPFGTMLGIFTIIVLMRDSAKRLFEEPNTQQAIFPGQMHR